ncbi:uncharacterized protein MYCFIDRAFT_207056 [Pseudocercospora fijiensis CIRAD86]|uniref:Uncharacterized protein n=1 Tax=Pseudocercospora fijiensis (strain CIRAD86) TaxID=383855 RepID=M3B322_PSEFD|nr:uncharacterized protein MYCFIDRAFT_207056 [Pseudocercospora fijiensis CIRAD86]EME83768.1 hypothetical protein MYCFIDRAFT_207056 [Pseudocercospora fijiensis CIRAD86]
MGNVGIGEEVIIEGSVGDWVGREGSSNMRAEVENQHENGRDFCEMRRGCERMMGSFDMNSRSATLFAFLPSYSTQRSAPWSTPQKAFSQYPSVHTSVWYGNRFRHWSLPSASVRPFAPKLAMALTPNPRSRACALRPRVVTLHMLIFFSSAAVYSKHIIDFFSHVSSPAAEVTSCSKTSNLGHTLPLSILGFLCSLLLSS